MCQSKNTIFDVRGGISVASRESNIFPNEVATVVKEVMRAPFRKRKAVFVVFVSFLIFCVLLFATLYALNRGFRRTCQFWFSITPVALEYKLIKFKSKYINRIDDDEYQRRINSFHKRTAPKMVQMVQSLGGIYVKIGQMLATVGAGFLDEEYMSALRPLQDGNPPRSKEQIYGIIEQSTGKKMEEMFESFDDIPVGAASIAQAHRATLRSTSDASKNSAVDNEVIVKVQYPEVASLFNIDFNNLELVTRWINPENLNFVQKLRKRHENELDFTIEAENLRECTLNMQAHGVEPRLIRLPRVRNETGLCTKDVLIMEYLQGISLADAIEEEQNTIAKALGVKNASELRTVMMKRMKEHFENGGGSEDGDMGMLTDNKMRLAGTAGPLALKVFRAYAQARESIQNTFHNAGVHINNALHKFNLLLAKNGDAFTAPTPRKPRINMSRALKTLIHVHGLQMIKDGVYNADPHPGNVKILPDGRLGLLDYGMVGRVSNIERHAIAKTILALSRNNRTETARLYHESGYRSSWADGEITDENLIHRIATFHLDRVDLSPVYVADRNEHIGILTVLKSTKERSVPDWVNQARRLGGLLIGVSSQAARPISLANEWKTIAADALREAQPINR